MAGGFGQYLKDTRGELRHVAWPTRTQTIVYTVLVAAISIGIALYLGFFDLIFTTGLTRIVQELPVSPLTITQVSTSSAATSTQTPQVSGPTFTIPTSTKQ